MGCDIRGDQLLGYVLIVVGLKYLLLSSIPCLSDFILVFHVQIMRV